MVKILVQPAKSSEVRLRRTTGLDLGDLKE